MRMLPPNGPSTSRAYSVAFSSAGISLMPNVSELFNAVTKAVESSLGSPFAAFKSILHKNIVLGRVANS
jgi:hypothetical protein